MSAENEQKHGAVDQAAFEKVMRENLSPAGIATIIAFLQPAAFYPTNDEAALAGLREAEWLAEALVELLGVDACQRLFEDLGL